MDGGVSKGRLFHWPESVALSLSNALLFLYFKDLTLKCSQWYGPSIQPEGSSSQEAHSRTSHPPWEIWHHFYVLKGICFRLLHLPWIQPLSVWPVPFSKACFLICSHMHITWLWILVVVHHCSKVPSCANTVACPFHFISVQWLLNLCTSGSWWPKSMP